MHTRHSTQALLYWANGPVCQVYVCVLCLNCEICLFTILDVTDGLPSGRQHYEAYGRARASEEEVAGCVVVTSQSCCPQSFNTLIDKEDTSDCMCFLIILFMGCFSSGKLKHDFTRILKGSSVSFWAVLSVIRWKEEEKEECFELKLPFVYFEAADTTQPESERLGEMVLTDVQNFLSPLSNPMLQSVTILPVIKCADFIVSSFGPRSGPKHLMLAFLPLSLFFAVSDHSPASQHHLLVNKSTSQDTAVR